MTNSNAPSGISVIMPTFNQAAFISRAIQSLRAQAYSNWELWIINDGSTDLTYTYIQQYLSDSRIHYLKNEQNQGLGFCLNQGLQHATHSLIAYLPSDDVYHKDHLATLARTLDKSPEAILAYSGVRHHYNRLAEGQIEGYALQLVQILHQKTDDRWVERNELVTDDLDRMFWKKLFPQGSFVATGSITCEWVDHPDQRHKIIREPIGGINPYKQRYGVQQPLRFHSTAGNYIDEATYYKPFRERAATPRQANSLKILLVGELAYNAERVLALEERGHQLYGLWMQNPYWYNTVGPVACGHITDIPYENWQQHLAELKPDIIYAGLNWQAVPFAHEVLTHNPGIPFVWHYKEGPFISLEKGHWNELIDLYTKSDGQLYTSPEMQNWFEQFLPVVGENAWVLDGDLPKKEWFTDQRSPLISAQDGAIHTVVPGRPIGLHPHTVAELAQYNIHLHFYGDFTHGQWKEWIIKTQSMAPGFLHIHPNVTQENWVKEFSQYDAGWLHFFQSKNNGELMRADWDDLNYPARMATLAAAGLPMLQRNNSGHIVATQTLIQKLDVGLFFRTFDELHAQLSDKNRVTALRENVWKQRMQFCFDAHADQLIAFFRQVIEKKQALQQDLSVVPLAAASMGDTLASAYPNSAL